MGDFVFARPQSDQQGTYMTNEIDPIPPEEAHDILHNAIRERLGEDWNDEIRGWTIITGHNYMMRLTKGRKNIDFYVDLLGNVTIEEGEVNPAQTAGRLMAWMFLLGSLLLAMLIARIAGYV